MDNEYEFEPGYRLTTEQTQESEKSCGTNWFLIILLIFLLLAVIGLVVGIIWYATHRNTKGEKLDLGDVKMDVTSNTSVTATWPNQVASGETYTLYASLAPPTFDSSGAVTNFKQKISVQTGQTATVTGLTPRLKYYATLVLTSTKTSNYRVYTQLVFMQTGEIPAYVATATGSSIASFAIDDILQIGKIEVQEGGPTGGVFSVLFNQSPIDQNAIWFYDTDKQIKLVNENLIVNAGVTGICLFNNNGILAAQECGTAGANNQWIYNPTNNQGYANRWCLVNSTGTTGTMCMELGTLTGGAGSTTVSVTNTTTAEDAWALAFQK